LSYVAARLQQRGWRFTAADLEDAVRVALTGSAAPLRRLMQRRRFPPPWSVEGLDACFVVRDGNGQQVTYTVMRVTGSRNKRFPVRLNSPFLILVKVRSTNSK
jgi:hypothetical protein